MGPAKFRAYLEAELGKRDADLITGAPGRQGERTDRGETSRHDGGKLEAPRKQERLRAPEEVQRLYREGLLPDGRVLSERALSKVRNDEQGHTYVERELVRFGARFRRPGESGAAWLREALQAAGVRASRHRGDHL